MDVALPNGVVVEGVPEGTTQVEVMRRAVAGGLITQAEAMQALAGPRRQQFAPSTGELTAESARLGLTDTASLFSGIGNILSNYNINPISGASRSAAAATGARPDAQQLSAGEAFRQGERFVREPLMRALGSTGAEPSTTGEAIYGGAVRAVTDPASYLFGSGFLRQASPAVRVMGAPIEQFAIGAGAQTGVEAGRATELPGAEFVGGMLGGITTGYGLSTSRRLADLTGKGLSIATKKVKDLTGTVPQDEILRDVNTRINNIFAAAAAADPNFMTVLEKAAKAQQNVSLKAPGAPEVRLPLNAMLADNPVINNFIQNLSSRDPKFQALYGSQFEAAKDALRANQLRLFGDPSQVRLTGISRADAAAQARATEKSVARQVRSLDQQIADAYSGQSIDPTTFGTRVENLLETKARAARESTKPLYKEAFDIAANKGVVLPSTAVDDIYGFVTSETNRDIFNKFPVLYSLVEKRFRPKTTEPSAILTAEGVPATPGGRAFSDVSPEALDSLKRRINADLRSTNNTDQIRFLTMLKEKVSGHIDNLDPDFVNAYRNADNAYLQRVGLPYNSETIKNVDRKRFVEQIAPALIGNRTNVDDLIRATGAEGERLARDAFYDSFTTAALKDGVIDPRAANKWLSKNASKMSSIQGLEAEMRGAVNNVQDLVNRRTALEANFRRVTGDQVVREGGFANAGDLVSKLYGDVDYTNKFMRQYGANKDAVNAVRSFMLDDLLKAGDPKAMLSDRNRAAVFNRVFGPTYAQKVGDFVEISSRLNRDPSNVSFRGETIPKTPIEEATGIPPEMILSRFNNPVSGKFYAMTSLFSKWWAGSVAKSTEEKLKNLLLNPADAQKVFAAIPDKQGAFDVKKINAAVDAGKRYGLNWVEDAIADISSGAARGAIRAGTSEAPVPVVEPDYMEE
jgi:hypothetical protein